ncbi:cell division protein ZapA [Candidatus Babeliales bacterium]|nr:cell division protein ZapA [Candidatus Babeliales bacterium]
MEEIKRLKVNIFGKSYSISTDENQEDVVKAVEMVNSLRSDIAQKTKLQDNFKIAVLVALKLAGRLTRTQKDLDLWLSNAKRLNDLLENNF